MKKYIKYALIATVAIFGLGVLSSTAKDVTLSIRYNTKSGFCISYTVPSDEPINAYINKYPGYQITGIERYKGAKNATLTKIDEVSFSGGQYTETEPIGEDKTLVVKASQNDGPTTGATDVAADRNVNIMVNGRTIAVEGAYENEMLNVCNIAGQTVYNGFGKEVEVPEAGVYIVKIGEIATKVLVK